MRKSLLLPFAFFGVALVFARPAAAEDDHAGAVSIAAHGRASKLRHRWDKARSEDAILAACLESKVLQSINLARRIDEHRATLRDSVDEKERARKLTAIDRMGARSAEVDREALACGPGASFPALEGTLVETKTSGNIAAEAAEQSPFMDVFGVFPPGIWSALLRLR